MALQLHHDGVLREVDEACAHVGVIAGDPWIPPVRGTRVAFPQCRVCGVWWPGHELAKPETAGMRHTPDWQTTDRDDPRIREPLSRHRGYTARWSNLA